ncbi:Dynamin- GTPase protein [Marasmius tenuissimus]|nr:Dynamin- GTPase protein [Marasmius tenuissimus]
MEQKRQERDEDQSVTWKPTFRNGSPYQAMTTIPGIFVAITSPQQPPPSPNGWRPSTTDECRWSAYIRTPFAAALDRGESVSLSCQPIVAPFLTSHICERLPDMEARLNTLISQAQVELTSFGDASLYADENSRGALILRLMTRFTQDFVSSIEGTNVNISTKELAGGARIYYVFNDVFGAALNAIKLLEKWQAELELSMARGVAIASSWPRHLTGMSL